MPTDAVATAREVLGRQLRDLRVTAHLTQQELADLLGYSRPRVAGAEKGESCALLFWQGCDKVLNANGALLACYREVEALRQQEADEAAAVARAERATRARESGGHLALMSPASLSGRDDEVARRIILNQSLVGDDVPGFSLLAAAEAVRRELEDTLARGTVSPARMDRIEQTVANHIGVYTRTPPTNACNWIGLLHLVIPVMRWVAVSGQGCPCQAGSGIQGSPWAAWVRASRAPMPWRAAVAR